MTSINSLSPVGIWRDALAVVASIVAGVGFWWVLKKPAVPVAADGPPLPNQPLVVDGAPRLGSRGAPVVLVVFSDFECPYSALFAIKVFPRLRARFVDTGEVEVVFRHWPLPIHRNAERASQAAACAAAQQRFWPMHDRLFAVSKNLEKADMLEHARQAGLDEVTFSSCMRGGLPTQVADDADLAVSLKLSGTPTFLIGRRLVDGSVRVISLVVGPRPIEVFDDAIQKARSKQTVY